MHYESPRTEKGNIGVSYISYGKAVEQAKDMDNNGCTNCVDCKYCMDCTGCMDCITLVDGKPGISAEQQIANLDKVGAIILDDEYRLDMRHWHGDLDWRGKTCAEEAICGTTHCLAGWLQVCATDQEIRNTTAQVAGALQAPIAAKLFFKDSATVLKWLHDREYVKELGITE